VKGLVLSLLFMLGNAALAWAQQDKIQTSPPGSYDRFIIFESLAVFWLGILGLIIIIKMKLRELERTHKMGLDKEEKEIPLLD
jgi:hypothetical protein